MISVWFSWLQSERTSGHSVSTAPPHQYHGCNSNTIVTRLFAVSSQHLSNYLSLTSVKHFSGKVLAAAIYTCSSLQDLDLCSREIVLRDTESKQQVLEFASSQRNRAMLLLAQAWPNHPSIQNIAFLQQPQLTKAWQAVGLILVS